jgi:hypothetical protein
MEIRRRLREVLNMESLLPFLIGTREGDADFTGNSGVGRRRRNTRRERRRERRREGRRK